MPWQSVMFTITPVPWKNSIQNRLLHYVHNGFVSILTFEHLISQVLQHILKYLFIFNNNLLRGLTSVTEILLFYGAAH